VNEDQATKSEPTDEKNSERRRYEPPKVTDFFQPVVALGSIPVEFCAARKPPKR